MKTTKQITQLVIFVMAMFFTHVSFSQTWNTGGNAGTNAATDYIGTSDNTDLVLRTFAVEKLRIQAGGNVGIGIAAPVQKLDVKGNINISTNNGLYINNKRVFFATSSSITKSNVYAGTNAGFTGTGYYNSFVGTEAGYSNSGGQNTFLGAYSGRSNSSGGQNTFAGSNSGHDNTTASNNSFFGNSAGYSDNTGSDNTFLGANSGLTNTTGYQNAFIGSSAGNQNIDGYANTATGYQALYINQHGSSNSASGYQALYNNTGSGNTAYGASSLLGNTSGQNNTALGAGALSTIITGQNNVGVGTQAGSLGSLGDENTLVGANTSFFYGGDGNTLIGYNAGSSSTISGGNSYYSTSIGNNASSAGTTNSTAIGHNAKCNVDNTFVFGNGSVTKWGFGKNADPLNIIDFSITTAKLTNGGVWTNASDKRLKENFKALEGHDVLDKISQLPITRWNYIVEGKTRQHIGPMAQDFYTLFKVGDDTTISTIDPAGIALRGIQELIAENKILVSDQQTLKSTVSELETKNKNQEERISALESAAAQSSASGKSSTTDGFAKMTFDGSTAITLLGQNIPNPFDQSTLIPFRIPANCHDAAIMITNTSTAEVVRIIPVACNEDHLSLEGGTFASGKYAYTLYVDGKIVATKQMELVR